jgi:hypothetical protein
MKEDGRIPATAEGMVATITEASLRLQVTGVLLGRLRGVRGDGLPLEQWDVLQQIEAELEAYRSYFYRPEHR